MVTSKKSLLPAVLLFSALVVSPNVTHAMYGSGTGDGYDQEDDQEDYDQEVSCLARTVRYLGISGAPIKISKADRLFAERYVNLFDDIKKFNNLTRPQKTELMDKFLSIAQAIRCGGYNEFLDRAEIAIVLCQNLFDDLVSRQGENKGEVDFLSHIMQLYKSNIKDKKTASAMILVFKHKYSQLSDETEISYLKNLDYFVDACALGDVSMKALLLECLNRCDHDFSQLDQQSKDSLSVRDLIEQWRAICGYKPTATGRALMAITGTEDSTYGNIFCGSMILGRNVVITFVVCFVVGMLINLIISDDVIYPSREARDAALYTSPSIIAACIAGVELVLDIGMNCVDYAMTKKL